MKNVIVFLLCFLTYVIVGSQINMWFDSKYYYGKAYAEEENYDDSQYHYDMMMQRKAALKYRVIFTFPDVDKKTTKVAVVYDNVNDVYCYVLENRPYNFKTGLNCFPGWYIRKLK